MRKSIPMPTSKSKPQNKSLQKQKAKPRFVYYDIGGVLLDFKHSVDYIAKYFKLDPKKLQPHIANYLELGSQGEMTANQCWRAIITAADGKFSETENYNLIWNQGCTPITKGHHDLVALAEKYPVGLFTNIWPDCLPIALQLNLIPNLQFKTIIQSWETKLMKPDHAAYQTAETAAGFSGSEILFIDDNLANLEAAQAQNWQVLKIDEDVREYLY